MEIMRGKAEMHTMSKRSAWITATVLMLALAYGIMSAGRGVAPMAPRFDTTPTGIEVHLSLPR